MEAGLYPSCSLNVFVPAPIVAPQPLAPSARLSDDVEMEEPSSSDDDGEQEQPADEENDEAMDEDSENEEEGEDEEDDMMHALPFPGHQPHAGNPFAGRGRGRGRGRGGMAFSGAGHALGSSSSSAPTQQPAMEVSTADQAANRRQRALEATANRAKEQESSAALKVVQKPKKIKERTVPSLQSLCSYEVAGNI